MPQHTSRPPYRPTTNTPTSVLSPSFDRNDPAPYNAVLSAGAGMNTHLQRMEYAVRGRLVQRAGELAAQLAKSPSGTSALPFDRIVYCNIGNPQSVGQTPLTFPRQVLAGLMYPDLIGTGVLPSDAEDRARMFLEDSHGLGAYSDSRGLDCVRERVAAAIAERDGMPADPANIFLANGASEAVKTLLSILIRGPEDGVLIPIPQYPLYSATMTSLNGSQVPYYLDEENGWSLSVKELQTSLDNAQREGVTVRALAVINPGNPTGQVLSEENMDDVVRFCEHNNLLIMADEVYQKNVYVDKKPFVSFKKVVAKLGSPVELASFHSTSKGMFGECGLRGGYVELTNFDKNANDLIYKVQSVSLCPNLVGQVAVELMMIPPGEGDPSYESHKKEVQDVYDSLRRKSEKMAEAFNTFKGVSCNRSEGAMYLFPRITLPEKSAEEAERQGLPCADTLYCLELLEATGICVVPGSGFGQKEGTLHFRTTFLPPEEQIDNVLERMQCFHNEFLDKYS